MNSTLLTEPTAPPELISEWADVLIRTAWRSLDRMDLTLLQLEAKIDGVHHAIMKRRRNSGESIGSTN